MRKVLKFIYTEFAYNGHLQTIGSLFKSIFAAQLFGIKITWDFIVVLYLSFYLSYIYNRYREIDIDLLTNKTRTEHLRKFDKQIPLIIALIAFGLVILVYLFSTVSFSIFLIFAVAYGLLYTDYFKGLTKKVFLFKNYYVALSFAMSIIFPFVYYSELIGPVFWGVAGISFFAFLRGVHMQIILDLKDIEGDKKEKLLTMGVLWGKEKVLKILKYSSVITAGIVPILIFLFIEITPAILILPIFIVFDFYIISLLKKDKFSAYILESGEFIFWSLLVALGETVINFLA